MPIWIKKVKIAFSKNMMTAYTGLSRMDSLYTGTGGNRTVQEHSPNSMSVCSKIIMYISIAYASTDRFVHIGCLGNKALLAALFWAQRMPEAATSLTRFFNKIKSLHYANIHHNL